jgi:steroid 5-alpha reductase family enzyme
LLSSQVEPGIQLVDLVFFGIEVLLVASEWISDGQQWAYQTAKYKYWDDDELTRGFTPAELDRGFVAKGLWAYSRHPNFFAEQSIWFILYSWSCFAANTPYSWAGTGAVLLVLLFQGSTNLTEKITAGKYPEYRAYQKHVGMFIPKTLAPYRTPSPRVLRSSELARRAEQKQAEQKQAEPKPKSKKKQG